MSAVVAAAAAATIKKKYQYHHNNSSHSISDELRRVQQVSCVAPRSLGRYELQKRRHWHMFGQYLKHHRPPLTLSHCSGEHVLEFLRYLDQFGKTKVHSENCVYFGNLHPPAPCPCPLKQGWGSLEALIGRLRVAFEENGGLPEMNPFDSHALRLYLKEVRDSQAKARGIAYEKNMEEDNHHHDLRPGIRRVWWWFC